MESKRPYAWLCLLAAVLLAGCSSVQSLNPMSRSHGLPAQSERDAEGSEN
ncbi:hypothetical protein [Planctomicrobium piriforme]|uniref:Uncharacterized protein n=1 Tax=Planctomicrobium piriforme TaxID=1576369 RepID=A0A1I3G8C9_9PLAN|nr:hypothetical protein [Planctomicrobium piriforme]SFI19492.1 hypothetical protein SAMN05421753_106226 [Planctomicrobium piriforme]